MTLNGIIGIIGGIVNVEVNKTWQLYPYLVDSNDYLIPGTDPSAFGYESSDTDAATVGADTGLITGLTVDEQAQITITYLDEDDGITYKDIIDVYVRPEGWYPPEPTPPETDWAQAENILKDKIAIGEDGEQLTGTAEVKVVGTTLIMPNGLISVS